MTTSGTVSPAERRALESLGFSDSQIQAMTPAQVRGELAGEGNIIPFNAVLINRGRPLPTVAQRAEVPSFLDLVLFYRRGWVRTLSVAVGVLAALVASAAFDLPWYWTGVIIVASALGVPAVCVLLGFAPPRA